jgi:hypothetical protein
MQYAVVAAVRVVPWREEGPPPETDWERSTALPGDRGDTSWNKRETELKRGELEAPHDDDGRRKRREESGGDVDGVVLEERASVSGLVKCWRTSEPCGRSAGGFYRN